MAKKVKNLYDKNWDEIFKDFEKALKKDLEEKLEREKVFINQIREVTNIVSDLNKTLDDIIKERKK